MSNGKSEEMLSQLIRMVGTIQPTIEGLKSEITEIKADIGGIKSEITEMKSDIGEIKCEQKSIREELQELRYRQAQFELKSENRHQEVMRAIHSLKADQDYIFQKTIRNEREIEKLKNQ